LIHLELDGTFTGNNADVVTVSCTTATPVLTMTADTATQILLTLTSVDDTCNFTLQNGPSTPTSLTVSSTQSALSITGVKDGGTDPGIASNNDYVIAGTFTGSSDQVWTSCDGAAFTQVDAASVTKDTTTEIDINLATPANFSSCEFYVVGNNVQSPSYP
jgi:hypothetical protein